MLQNGNLQFPVYEELADGQQPYTMEKLDTRLWTYIIKMVPIMKKLLILLLALITPLFSKAYDAKVNGIYYYLDYVHKTASVTYSKKYNADYSGDIFIPKEIAYNNKKYSVISIYDEAFYGCSMLSSVTIPSSAVSIGNSAFYGCI